MSTSKKTLNDEYDKTKERNKPNQEKKLTQAIKKEKKYSVNRNISIIVVDVAQFPVDPDLFHGYNLGLPKQGQEILGVDDFALKIRGWVVGKNPVVAVEVVSKDKVIQEIPITIKRPDVIAKFSGNLSEKQVNNWGNWGFDRKVNLKGITANTELLVQAVFSDARRVPMALVKLELSNLEDLIDSKDLTIANVGPDFLIIGAMKAATSAIYSYLEQHPLVIRRSPKELHFFAHRFERGLNWYLSNFTNKIKAPSNQKWLIGEASPSYLHVNQAPSRVKKLFPNVKIIVSLRNPTERAISQYYHQVIRVGDEKRTIEEAFSDFEIEKSIEIIALIEQEQRNFHLIYQENAKTAQYLLFGQYVSHLKNWLEIFPREQILILNYHELESHPKGFVRKLFTFLDLQDDVPTNIRKIYGNKYQPAATSVKQRLNEYYRPHNKELERFLKMKFGWS